MSGYLRSILSYFWDDSGTDLSLDEAYNVLDNAKDTVEEKPPEEIEPDDFEDYSCYHKTGTITAAKDCNYTIDDVYEFKSTLQNLNVGMEVSFTVYTCGSEVKVSDVLIKGDWYEERNSEKSSWCVRNKICKVTKRDGRQIIVEPGSLVLDLNTVSSEFIPIIGDWLEVQAKVELDEQVTDLSGKILEIEKIRPVRPRVLQGWVKQWSNETRTGVIDRVVYFNGDVLSSGYVPIVGDKVVAEVMESEQGRYSCRALKILPERLTEKQITLTSTNLHEFDTEHDDVAISEDILIQARKLGEKHDFAFKVCNKMQKVLILLNVTLPSNNLQCEIINPTSLVNINIMPGECVNFEGVCTVKGMGTTKEPILFIFEHYKIGRWVTANVDSNTRFNRSTTVDRGSILLPKNHFKGNRTQWVRGQKVLVPPRFISARLPDYPVPQKLLNLVVAYDEAKTSQELIRELRLVKPCLTKTVTANIYEDRFHTLLHLEEICHLIEAKSYEQDRALLIKNGEFLMLEIENLSEKRPSLIVGDRIIVKDPYNAESLEFEGFVYKVAAKHIYLKFAQNFHDHYNGEDVAVMAVIGRTTFRRMHQAVGLAVRNLGSSFLFPSKVIVKDPQVKFTYEKYYDTTQKDISEKNCNATEKKLSRNEKVLEALKKYSPKNADSKDINVIKPDSENVQTQLLLVTADDKTPKQNKKNVQPKVLSLELQNVTFKLEWYNNSLNYYQKEAVRNIVLGVARPLPYFIFGPPGTGKTVTLVETILQLLRLIPHSRLLVATPSNSAADLIALRLIDAGVLKPGDLVRLVAYRCVVENMLPVKLIPYCATADIAREGTTARSFITADNGLTLGCNSTVIGRHRITVGTCTSIGVLYNMGFSKGHFTHIIMDEAGQATEPEVMIPFSLLDVYSGQVILAGDPLQLGPVLTSKAATEYGLEETYLDRMLHRFPYTRDSQGFPETGGYDPRLVTKLVYNYRSLPEVLTLSSNLFYDGQLIPTISATDSDEARLLNRLRDILPKRQNSRPPSVVFHGVIGENLQTSDCPSWFNPNEASQIFFYVNELYRMGLKSTDIGIISPYTKQVRQIRALLVEAEFDVPKVGTVEEFQGQEFNVILLSTVRSSDTFKRFDLKYKLGFLSNPRRLNVAITRAQALIIIVGNPHLLINDPQWRSVIKYCVDHDAYIGCDLPYSG